MILILRISHKNEHARAIFQSWAQTHAFIVGDVLFEECQRGAPGGKQFLLRLTGFEMKEFAVDEGSEFLLGYIKLPFEHKERAVVECTDRSDAMRIERGFCLIG